jgi:hypothetical protein
VCEAAILQICTDRTSVGRDSVQLQADEPARLILVERTDPKVADPSLLVPLSILSDSVVFAMQRRDARS